MTACSLPAAFHSASIITFPRGKSATTSSPTYSRWLDKPDVFVLTDANNPELPQARRSG